MSAFDPSLRGIAKNLLLIATLTTLGLLASHGNLDVLLSEQWINTEVRGKGWQGELIFLGVGALTTALAFPRQIVAFLGGYAFGFIAGSFLATLASVLGCIAGFYFSRWLIRQQVQQRFPGRIRKFDAFLRLHPFSMAVTLRLLPIGSNALISLLAGVSSVRSLPFFAGSGVGYLPQALIFALAGSGVSIDAALRLPLAGTLFVLSSAIGIWLYRQHHGHTLATLGQTAPAKTCVDTPTGVRKA